MIRKQYVSDSKVDHINILSLRHANKQLVLVCLGTPVVVNMDLILYLLDQVVS